MLLLVQATRKQQERKYLGPMITFHPELSVMSLPTLKPLPIMLGISQRYESDSHDRHPEITMAVIINLVKITMPVIINLDKGY